MPSKNPALLSIFAPASDGYVVRTHGAECADESTGQTGIGQQWNIQVYGSAADTVAVTQFACSQILRDIHHHVNLLSVQHLQRLRLTCLAGPRVFSTPCSVRNLDVPPVANNL